MATIERIDTAYPSGIIEHPQDKVEIKTLAELGIDGVFQAARVYFDAWHEADNWENTLCPDFPHALHRMKTYDRENTRVLLDENKNIIAVLNTLPFYAKRGIADIIQAFPTYSDLEWSSRRFERPDGHMPNYLICFSITADKGHKIRTTQGSVSPSQFLLENFNNPWKARKLAYSRFKGPVPMGQNLEKFYFDNIKTGNTNVLGAVGMHEHYGGIAVAFLSGSRPEDTEGGKGNVLVIYPKNEEERRFFNLLKFIRKENSRSDPRHGLIPIYQDNAVIASDLVFLDDNQ